MMHCCTLLRCEVGSARFKRSPIRFSFVPPATMVPGSYSQGQHGGRGRLKIGLQRRRRSIASLSALEMPALPLNIRGVG